MDPQLLADLPRPEGSGRLICLDTVDSTNRYLKALAAQGAAAGTVVLAERQTAGRGRLGRSFHSPQGCGLYLSMLLRPDCTPAEATDLTGMAGVAVCRAIEHAACGVSVGIKWVNDLVWEGRKLGGILTEAGVENGRLTHIVLGVGLNRSRQQFPEELRDKAVSLEDAAGHAPAPELLAAEVIRELDALRTRFPGGAATCLEAYRARCVTLGRAVVFPGGEGIAERIDEHYALVVRRPDGSTATLTSGEVSVRGREGYV